MQTIRIFISSPGDVADERERAKSVVEELRRRYAGRLQLCAIFWEDIPLRASLSFQQGIDVVLSERGVDVAVFILWSRLGTPLGHAIPKPDGSSYRSGTEREWELMWSAFEKSGGVRPEIIVYTRKDESSFDESLRGLPLTEKEEKLQQKKLVEHFIAEEFYDAEGGTNVSAFHTFDRPTTFAQRLRVHLQELLDPIAGQSLAEPIWDIAEKGSPFQGLEAFDVSQAPVFFGREDEIVAIRHALREQARRGCAFMLVAGASGSGKSSLVRAGVLPAIATHEIDSEISGWRMAIFSPGDGSESPLANLARALAAPSALPVLLQEPGGLEQLTTDLARDPEMVCRRVLLPALTGNSSKDRLLVLVDQMEELFTDTRITEDHRAAFVSALEALARSGFAWVVATVRSDFYAHCQSLPGIVRLKEGGGQYDLLPPSADALNRLIRQPAALAGLSFEQRGDTSVADLILRDAVSHRELLPLVEYLLHRLTEERSPDGVLSFKSYEILGGVEGALASRADHVLAELNPPEQTLDFLLSSLVTLSGDEQESFVRRRVPRADLERDDASRLLVETLVEERLLTSSASSEGSAVITVAHEALFRVWPPAVTWLSKNREFLRLRANVMQSFTRWQGAERDPSLLLPPGLLLEEAGRLLEIEAGRLENPLREYIQDSIKHQQDLTRRAALRRRFVMASLSLLSALAVVAAVMAFRQRSEALSAQSNERHQRELVQERENTLRSHLKTTSMAGFTLGKQRIENPRTWQEGLAYLAGALEADPDNVAAARLAYTAILHNAASIVTVPRHALPLHGKLTFVDTSKDGRFLVTAINEEAQLWDLTTRQPRGEAFKFPGKVKHAALSRDASKLALSDGSSTIIWDTNSGKRLHEKSLPGSVGRDAFRPDGLQIVLANKAAELRETLSGELVGKPLGTAKKICVAAFSPDGTKVLTQDMLDVSIWDLKTGHRFEQPVTIDFDESGSGSTFSPDGKLVAVGFQSRYGGHLYLLDSATGNEVYSDEFTETGRVRFSPDSTLLTALTGQNNSELWLYGASKAESKNIYFRHEDTAWSESFDGDGRRLLTVCRDGAARVWRVSDGSLLGIPIWHEDPVIHAAFTADGRHVVTATQKGVWLWDAPDLRPPSNPLRHTDYAFGTFNSDGSKIITSSERDKTRVWDVTTHKPGNALFAGTQLLETGRMGNRIVTRGEAPLNLGAERWSVFVWDAHTHQVVGKPLEHPDDVELALLSPDEETVLTLCADEKVRIWKPATGELLAETPYLQDVASTACFTPDGKRFVTATYSAVQFWHADSARPSGKPIEVAGVNDFDIDDQGSLMAMACSGRVVRVWDLAKGALLGQPFRHEQEVKAVRFSPSGDFIFTLCADRVHVWETATGTRWGSPIPSSSLIDISPDGQSLLGMRGSDPCVWDIRYLQSALAPVNAVTIRWIKAVGGLEHVADGTLKPVTPSDRLAALVSEQSMELAAWSDLRKWLATPLPGRPVTPGSLSFARMAMQERDSGPLSGAQSALCYDPTVPLARLLIARGMERINANRTPPERDTAVAQRVEFLRRYDIDRLPDDPSILLRASSILLADRQAEKAIETARKAHALDQASFASSKALASVLYLARQYPEALTLYPAVLSHPDATIDDFAGAGYATAITGDETGTRDIFTQAEQKFPASARILRMKGWAMMELHHPEEALTAFRAWDKLRAELPSSRQRDAVNLPDIENGLAGYIASLWATGDKEAAITQATNLLRLFPKYADPKTYTDLAESGKPPLQAALTETLARFPELVPKKPAADAK